MSTWAGGPAAVTNISFGYRKQIISAQNSIAMDVTHPVAGLDRPTENTAKGIKSGAVLLGVQLGNVHQQRTPGVAVLYVPHNLSALRTRIDSCNLQRKEHGLNVHCFSEKKLFPMLTERLMMAFVTQA